MSGGTPHERPRLSAGLLLGIDPGACTGLALFDPEAGRLAACTSAGFWEAVERVQGMVPHLAGAVVEDARRVGLYARHRQLRGPRRDAAARSVGEIDAQVRLWLELLQRLRRADGAPVPVATAEPTRRKWDADAFGQITGWEGRTNEHARDAARLVWGLSPARVRLLAQCEGRSEAGVLTRRSTKRGHRPEVP